MSGAIPAQKSPYAVNVEAGKKYYWCACGRSATQPFCDGAHKAVGMAPMMFTAAEIRAGLAVRLQGDARPALLRRFAQQAVRRTRSDRMMGRYVTVARGLMAMAALGLVAGCSLFPDKRDKTCPKVEVIDALSKLVQFADGPGRDLSDMLYAARIEDVKSACAFDKSGVRVEMTVSIVGDRAQAGAKLKGSDVTYFVAITDASQAIVAKKLFTSRLDFSDNKTARIDDVLDQRIPLTVLTSAAEHTIIVGFQLSPEQINFNQKPPGS